MPAYKYQTSDGKTLWYCSFHYKNWVGENKRKKKKGFQTRKAALEWERKFLDQQKDDPNMLFSSLAENYLRDREARFKPTTYNNIYHIIHARILPYFQNVPIADISPAMIRKWQTELMDYKRPSGKGYSQTYLKLIHAQMSSMMNFAIKYYGLKQSPCTVSGRMGSGKCKEMSVWTRDEFERFIPNVDRTSFRLAFSVLFYSGIREGELLALTPADITDGSISINKNYQVVKGKPMILEPKTVKSKRVVPIHDKLYNELEKYIAEMRFENDDRIFTMGKVTLRSDFRKWIDRVGLNVIRIHDLRHSHASMLIDMGVPITEICVRLGHESPKITLSTYSHMFKGNEKNVVNRINALFEDDSGTKQVPQE